MRRKKLGDILETAERLWLGELDPTVIHPIGALLGEVAEPIDGVGFVLSFANVSAISTGDGLILVDTGSRLMASAVHEELRRWSVNPLHTAIYSHGHLDHICGVPVWEAEAQQRGWPAPIVVAHEAILDRFDRYVATAGYNAIINQRQFGVRGFGWPTEYRYPDITYRSRLELDVGGTVVVLNHARGETDDHTWTWLPEHKVLCCGDFFIWASPNAGNPQKVQRYPKEWAAALRAMSELDAEVLLPGHGFPVMGVNRVRQALTDTAMFLEDLVEQTLALMNIGARLDDVIHTVRPLPNLLDRPYLQPIYDEPEFVVRNIWRLYGGWWDGNPASLRPAPEEALARELAQLCGGTAALADRALALLEEADGAVSEEALRLAGHVAELAAQADPDDPYVQRVRANVNEARAKHATSTMAKGIFDEASRESTARANGRP